MQYARKLRKGDKVAIVSLSSGMLGEKFCSHNIEIGVKRLKEYGLEPVFMPNALKGIEYLQAHPQARAKDLKDAFLDNSIAGIICAIGGEDTIRLLPYIDYDVIRNNPKIFMGFSDTTANHLMMYKAGLVSYYGPALICDFANYVDMYDYTENAVRKMLFDAEETYEIKKCDYWTNEFISWCEENMNKAKKHLIDEKGYEVLQGHGKAAGKLLGGCLDAMPMYIGTDIWPSLEEWKDKILFLETSEEKPSPDLIRYYLRNLGAQGILGAIRGIICGKPQGEVYYEEYKEQYKMVLKEYGREDMIVIYNANFGHSEPIGIIPFGIECEIDADNKTIKLLERVVE